MNKLKIVYLTWGETPRPSGVFGSQVIEQFVHARKKNIGELFFISGVPFINSSFVNEMLDYFKVLKEVRNKLDKIPFYWINIWSSQNFVYSNRFSFFLMHGISHFTLAKLLVKLKPNIVHCRSLHAAYTAIKVKQYFKFDYKIIFDVRSPFPEAVMLQKNYEKNNKNYIFLKSIESFVFKNSDSIIAVSDTMKTYYEEVYRKEVDLIYLSTDTKKLENCVNYSSGKKSVSFVYVGALTKDGWHQIENLVQLFRKLTIYFNNSTLKIITKSNHQIIRDSFAEFSPGVIEILSTNNIDELKKELSTADIACLSYFNPQTYSENILSQSVLAVKTVEYLSAGLPVICNKNCGGAVKILEDYNVGLVYNPNSLLEISYESVMKLLNNNVKTKAMEIAKKLFEYEVNAEKYNEIYKKLS